MTFTVEIKARPGKVNELYQTLQALLLTMRKEEGCLDARISRDPREGRLFVLEGEWEPPGRFEGYLRSGSGSALIGAVELLGESSRVRLGSDAKWDSVDALKRMRSAG